MRRQLADVAAEESKLRAAERRFASAVEAFRARRDVLSARYTAAEAQFEAQRSLAGLSGELNGIGEGIQRAESKIERMQARATALDDLLSSGVLESLNGDQIEDELRRHTDPLTVEAKLEELKRRRQEGEPT